MTVQRRTLLSFWTIQLQEQLSCICCIAMVLGFLFSRGVLSIAMIVMFLNACHPAKLKGNWELMVKSSFAKGCLLFFSVYLISGLWSSDLDSWLVIMQIKLPFIFLPFCLLNAPLQSLKYRKMVIQGILIVLLCGVLYSLSYLLQDPYFLEKNRHLPSPVSGDYIRFTIVLVFGLQFVFYLFMEKKVFILGKGEKILLLLWAVLVILYIHIQAAKSGLLCLYIIIGLYLLFVFQKKGKVFLFSVLACLGIIAMTGVFFIPSLNKQVRNISYEKQVWRTNDTTQYNKTSSFVPRLISYKIAGAIVREHPVIGVGAGDLKAAMDEKYRLYYPNIIKAMRLKPHNQFLCTVISVGIPLSAVLIYMLFAPLAGTKRRIYSIATLVIMFTGLMIEPMLETQYGIFVYLFFTLFWVALLKKESSVKSTIKSQN